MAQFKMNLPKDIIEDFEKIYNNSDAIFGAMTKAGAEVVQKNIENFAPLPEMAQNVRLTRTYKTPSDDGINTKVYITGYLPFRNGRTSFTRMARGKLYTTEKGVPLAFLANLYEYGRSTAPFPKKPFLRKSFKKNEIEKAMLEAQKKASGGLLE